MGRKESNQPNKTKKTLGLYGLISVAEQVGKDRLVPALLGRKPRTQVFPRQAHLY